MITWLLGPSGPLLGNAHVYLVDKAYFVVRTVVDLLVEDGCAGAMAVTLYRAGRSALPRDAWRDFHDQQTALSGERLALLGPVDLTFADSRSDPRVQVADLLAGVARRLAWEVLEDRGNAALIALLRPYVDPHSIWADDRSWSLLTR
ncbi:MAG TPA: hypothetical protein VFC00_14095 [Micromonosporaceae bacterium]|nr:hypothetical protein [Micromonosporaceae bacterium]